MADTLCHATQGGLLLLAPFFTRIRRKAWIWVLGGIGALFGALPDLLGAFGTFILHDHWALYFSAHRGAVRDVLQYVPMYWLHLTIDQVTHGAGQRWWIWSERVWIDLVLWCLNLLVIALMYRHWKRREAGQPARLPVPGPPPPA